MKHTAASLQANSANSIRTGQQKQALEANVLPKSKRIKAFALGRALLLLPFLQSLPLVLVLLVSYGSTSYPAGSMC